MITAVPAGTVLYIDQSTGTITKILMTSVFQGPSYSYEVYKMGAEEGVSIAWGVVFPVLNPTRKTQYSFYGLILFLRRTIYEAGSQYFENACHGKHKFNFQPVR